MSKKIPKISDTEYEVMKILWKKYPVTSAQVIEELTNIYDWSSNTIKTYLNRLLKKEVIGYELKERKYLYYPNFSQEECRQREMNSFIKRVFDGAGNVMLANFIKTQPLAEKDIEKLRELLKERENVDE